MFGDLQGAMELATKALPLARSRDEVSPSFSLPLSLSLSLSLSLWLNHVKALEVLNIKIMTEVQLAAVLEIQKSNGVSS
jgi:hypothetical protein